jgi:hydrogenase-4 component H
MNILNLLSQNMDHGSRTLPPDDAVPYPAGYRGRLSHAVALCTACGTCAYTCSPGAITIENDARVARWNYQEDRCTFCGFCVQYCPTQALSFERLAPAPLTERAQHYLSHEIVLQPCRTCGQPVHMIPEVTLINLYGNPLPKDILAAQGLCERCRQESVSKRFLKAVVGKGGGHGE